MQFLILTKKRLLLEAVGMGELALQEVKEEEEKLSIPGSIHLTLASIGQMVANQTTEEINPKKAEE